MIIEKNIGLQPYHTFGLPAFAKYFGKLHTIQDVEKITQSVLFQRNETLILGGGSNLLFTKNYDGLVLLNSIKGITVAKETAHSILLKVGGGEVWHDFVLYCVEHGYGGIENLSLIPGTVGAAPIQNIGAYGVELKDIFVKLEAFSFEERKVHIFEKEDCKFGYRDSIFKKEKKGKYCIVAVYFELTKIDHQIDTTYGAIKKVLELKEITNPSIEDISKAVIEIRQSKLPDPKVIGNAGSFFKNPIIPRSLFEKLVLKFPNMVHYPVDDNSVKVPAGWLIEQCGWKGKRVGNTGSYKNQALVLVNHGEAKGEEVSTLAAAIIASVKEKYNIELTPEVNIL